MATNVSMQSPISDYGNFGQVASANWNAAQERALKDSLAAAENKLVDKQLNQQDWINRENAKINWDKNRITEMEVGIKKSLADLTINEHNYAIRQRELAEDVARHKMKIKDRETDLAKKYKRAQEHRIENRAWYDYMDVFGIGDDSYWHPEDESFEDWKKEAGYDDIYKDDGYDDYVIPDDAGIDVLRYYSGTDEEIEGSLGMPNQTLWNFVMDTK